LSLDILAKKIVKHVGLQSNNIVIKNKLALLIFVVLGFNSVKVMALAKCNISSDIENQYSSAKKAIETNSLDSLEKIRQAAFQGHAVAAHEMGFYYVKGKYFSKNYRLAYQWFKVGATRGQHNSMFSLAIMHHKGEGRPVSLATAYAWYRLAGKYIPTKINDYVTPDSTLRTYHTAAVKMQKTMNAKQLTRGKEIMYVLEKEIICKWYLN